jgi:hypothetical protein
MPRLSKPHLWGAVGVLFTALSWAWGVPPSQPHPSLLAALELERSVEAGYGVSLRCDAPETLILAVSDADLPAVVYKEFQTRRWLVLDQGELQYSYGFVIDPNPQDPLAVVYPVRDGIWVLYAAQCRQEGQP